MLFIRRNGVVGTTLWELRCWNCVVGTALLKLRCWNFVVRKSQTIVQRTFAMKSPSHSHVPSCEAHSRSIRQRHSSKTILNLSPAIRSKLLASLKGFPLLSGVLYSAKRISPERISPFGMHPRSGPVPSGFIHEVE